MATKRFLSELKARSSLSKTLKLRNGITFNNTALPLILSLLFGRKSSRQKGPWSPIGEALNNHCCGMIVPKRFFYQHFWSDLPAKSI